MNKWLEYIKLIPKGLENIDDIVEGIVTNTKLRYNTLSEAKQDEIIRRRIICKACPFMSLNTGKEYEELTGEVYTTERKGEHCSFCSCGIQGKTATLSADCGAVTWNYKHPENKIELKWTKYEEEELQK